MARGWFVEGRGNYLAPYGALHLGHLFRALVYEQHHHVAIGIVGRNRMGDVLHHHRLTAFGRRDQQGALAFADGRDDVDDASGNVLLALVVLLQAHLHFGEQRRQVLEHDFVFVALG